MNTPNQKTQLYLINASMSAHACLKVASIELADAFPACAVMAGIMTIIQSTSISFGRFGQWGAGTLSVMGVSFTTVPISQLVIPQLMGQCVPRAGWGARSDSRTVRLSASQVRHQ